MRALWSYLIICVVYKSAPQEDTKYITHCLDSGPIRLPDPFSTTEKQLRDVKLTWSFLKELTNEFDSGSVEVIVLESNGTYTLSDRYNVYQSWGLEIHNATVNDTGVYTAELSFVSQQRSSLISKVNVTVASPPILKTAHLFITGINTTSGLNLTCGQVSSLGYPPTKLFWITPNHTFIDVTFDRNSLSIGLQLTLNTSVDATNFSCQADFSSPAGSCIAQQDLWKAYYEYYEGLPGPTGKDISHMLLMSGTIALAILAAIASYLVYKQFQTQVKEILEPRFSNRHVQKGRNENDSDLSSPNESSAQSQISNWNYLQAESAGMSAKSLSDSSAFTNDLSAIRSCAKSTSTVRTKNRASLT